jgi:hypothetical protein
VAVLLRPRGPRTSSGASAERSRAKRGWDPGSSWPTLPWLRGRRAVPRHEE